MDLVGVKNHIVMCGWNSNAPTVLKELTVLYKHTLTHFVVIAEEVPEYKFDHTVHFIKGDYTKKEILDRAVIKEALGAIVLADRVMERSTQDIDARTILTTLALKKINNNIYICVEILSPENVEHLNNTGVEEYILSADYTGNLLAHSIKNKGITKVYNELLRSDIGSQISKISPPSTYINKTFKDCAIDLLHKQDGTMLIGIERNNEYYINPDTKIIQENDLLVVIER